MSYKVIIESGKGKNFMRRGSTSLSSKEDVKRWTKERAFNNRANTTVYNIKTGKSITGQLSKFRAGRF